MTDRDGRARSAAGALLGAIVALSAACGEAPEPPSARAVSDLVPASGEVTMPAPADTIELGPRMRARGMSFRAPAAWTHLPANSPIRIAQFIIPPGDVSNYGELVVFHFGPGEGEARKRTSRNGRAVSRRPKARRGRTWRRWTGSRRAS